MAKDIRQRCLAHHCGALLHRPNVFCPDHWRRLPTNLQQEIWRAIEGDDHGALVRLVDAARDVLIAQKQNRKPSG
jgi:hypothetical protein